MTLNINKSFLGCIKYFEFLLFSEQRLCSSIYHTQYLLENTRRKRAANIEPRSFLQKVIYASNLSCCLFWHQLSIKKILIIKKLHNFSHSMYEHDLETAIRSYIRVKTLAQKKAANWGPRLFLLKKACLFMKTSYNRIWWWISSYKFFFLFS